VREPVELFAAVRAGESSERALPRDPVCRMAVDPKCSAGRLTYEDTAYFFCSLACAAEFARQPERFARERARPAGARSRRYVEAEHHPAFPDRSRSDASTNRTPQAPSDRLPR
jgi:YHS domain-containing protein